MLKKTEETNRLFAMRQALHKRSQIHLGIREFFAARNFIEVETPVRLPAPALETHIDAEPSGDFFLRTSPELHMKRLLAAGYERIFQLGPCFRKGERGDRHHPEYTMLEWYRTGADYLDILSDTKALLQKLSTDTGYCGNIDFQADWTIIPVAEAFLKWAGWDPTRRFDAERFDFDLVEKVEPALPRNQPVILIDYPVEAGAFARRKAGFAHLAERWELYLGGLEIANTYSELIDSDEQLSRFAASADDRIKRGKPVYPMDEAFVSAIKNGLPPCAGIALGLDRLLMVFTGASSLDNVIAFRE
jgi:elongation factor P--(R)-beta-lysine ligase